MKASCGRLGRDPGSLVRSATITAQNKSDAIYSMLRDFKRRGVPIDGVGFKMRISNLNLNVASFSQNVARFTALGLQVHITEMGVRVPLDDRETPSREI